MSVVRLETKRVEKPWGRRDLWPGFPNVEGDGEKVGEVWFEKQVGGDPELLIKYLFTSEKLSVQVHPDDAAARAAGYKRGKDEAWLILAAEPHATIALGTRQPMSKDELRASALDGTIEGKLDWKAVRAGDFYYSPAGTVHAIGPGLTVIEMQQNVDLTYRLYDYGSDRELHLDAGIAVSDPVPYVATHFPRELAPGRTILADGAALVIERWSGGGAGRLVPAEGRPVWLIPVSGSGSADGETLGAGGVWLADAPADLAFDDDIDLLITYPGADVVDGLRT